MWMTKKTGGDNTTVDLYRGRKVRLDEHGPTDWKFLPVELTLGFVYHTRFSRERIGRWI